MPEFDSKFRKKNAPTAHPFLRNSLLLSVKSARHKINTFIFAKILLIGKQKQNNTNKQKTKKQNIPQIQQEQKNKIAAHS